MVTTRKRIPIQYLLKNSHSDARWKHLIRHLKVSEKELFHPFFTKCDSGLK